MAGGGGGGGKAQRTPRQSEEFEGFLKEFRADVRPIREESFRQIAEALQTGGIGSRLPIATKAVEATRSATSNALTQIDESLARSNLAGTPFGENIRASQVLSGELEAARIPTDFAAELTRLGPGLATGTAGTLVQGLGTAAGQQRGTDAQNAALFAETMQALMGGASSAGGKIGAAAALGCWIASVLYGSNTSEFYSARYWIFTGWQGPLARLVQEIYLRFGERVSRSRIVPLLHPLFNRAVAHGRLHFEPLSRRAN